MISTIEIDFIQEIKKAGIEPPENIAVDGQFHRFSSDGRPSDKPGWYVLNDCLTAQSQVHSAAGEMVSRKHGLPSKCQD